MNIAPIRSAQRGFTLIELLIVVIILAILAAIVIPQFASTTNDAREGALDANLSTMRSAIELYKVQHKNVYPGASLVTSGGTCTGTKGTGGTGPIAFVEQLTFASDINGNTCSVADPTYGYGPYFRNGLPAEPVTSKADVVVTTTGTVIAPSAATGGWAYDSKSGQLVMNSNALDIKGNKYSTH